jgi:integrase
LLLANTEGLQHLFLATIFRQGWRITETIRLQWDDVDLQKRVFAIYVAKSDAWKVVPMHDDLLPLYAAVNDKTGRVFPWYHSTGVYKWLWPLRDKLKVNFTPHMARHEFASTLSEAGASDAAIQAAGSWTSARSVGRYTSVDMDHAREILPGRVAKK